MIVVATVTPDEACPLVACRVQAAIGAHRAAGFDLSAACSGFMNGPFTGERLVASGTVANCLVIGADVMSSLTDYERRDMCVLFGDAAGAVFLGEPRDRGSESELPDPFGDGGRLRSAFDHLGHGASSAIRSSHGHGTLATGLVMEQRWQRRFLVHGILHG